MIEDEIAESFVDRKKHASRGTRHAQYLRIERAGCDLDEPCHIEPSLSEPGHNIERHVLIREDARDEGRQRDSGREPEVAELLQQLSRIVEARQDVFARDVRIVAEDIVL